MFKKWKLKFKNELERGIHNIDILKPKRERKLGG